MGDMQGKPATGSLFDWRPMLLASAATLNALPGSVEADYLALGESLQDFYNRACALSETSASVSSRTADQDVAKELNHLQTFFDQAGSVRDGSHKSVKTLDSILEELCRTRTNLVAFTNITRHLHSLCNMIKIETARLGSSAAGFSTLAADVGELVKRIEEKATILSDQSDSLITLIRGSFQRVAQLESQQKVRVRLILDDAVRKLEEITRHQAVSSSMLQELSQQWNDISQDIGNIVMSMQSHDITRQQIEHVVHVLEDVAGTPLQDPEGDAHLALRACVLQRAQLENASQEVTTAGERIVGSLRHLAATVKGIATRTRKAMEGSEHRSATFMGELENGLVSILTALKDYEDLNGTLQQTLEHVAEPVKKMSTFLREIAQIGTSLRMVGLNACIHAAHVGDQGVALSVLAESIHRVAGETSENIHSVSSRLESVVALADEIADLSDHRSQESSHDTHAVRQHLESTITDLSQAVQGCAAALGVIEEEAGRLSEELGRASVEMQAHRTLESGVEGVLVDLEGLLVELEVAIADRPATAQESSRIEQFLSRYTMQSERKVHRAVMEQPRGDSPEHDDIDDFLFQPSSGPVAAEDDLGDNVELF